MFKELLVLWPEVKIVHGRPRHAQSQGSCERANWDVAKMLRAWQHDRKKANKPTGFAIGLYEIQMKKINVFIQPPKIIHTNLYMDKIFLMTLVMIYQSTMICLHPWR